MIALDRLKETIDQLPPEEFTNLYNYIRQHKRARTLWAVVPPQNLREIMEIMRPVQEEAAAMSDEEINALIDQAIAEVRRERKAKSGI